MMSNLLGRINMTLHCSFGECRRPLIVIRRSLACQLTAMMNPHLVCVWALAQGNTVVITFILVFRRGH